MNDFATGRWAGSALQLRRVRRGRSENWILGLALMAGCHCGRRAEVSSEDRALRLVPAGANAIVLLPRVERATAGLGTLMETLGKIPGGDAIQVAAADLVAQLQADPMKREGLEKLGIDASGAAVAWFPLDAELGAPAIALPVKDEGVIAQHLAVLAQRAGSVGLPQVTADGVREFRTASGALVLATVVRDGFLVVARSEEPLRPKPPPDSATWGDLRALQAQEEGEVEAIGYIPAATILGVTMPVPVVFGVRLGGHGIHVRATLRMLPAVAAAVSLLGTEGRYEALPGDAVMTLRLAGAPSALGQILSDHGAPQVVKSLAVAGIDLQKDIFDNLQSGIAIAISLAKVPDFGTAPSLDPRIANPFRDIRLTALARVVDAERAKVTLRKLSTIGRYWGVLFSSREVGGQTVLVANYALGESISLALVDKTLVVTGGEDEMAAALDLVKRNPSPVAAPAPQIHLRLMPARLVAQIRAIPAMSYGGLTGLTLRSLFSRLLEPLTHFGALSVDLDADANAGVLVGEVDLPLQ